MRVIRHSNTFVAALDVLVAGLEVDEAQLAQIQDVQVYENVEAGLGEHRCLRLPTGPCDCRPEGEHNQ